MSKGQDLFIFIYLYRLSIIISVPVPKVKFISKVMFGGKSVPVPKVKFISKVSLMCENRERFGLHNRAV